MDIRKIRCSGKSTEIFLEAKDVDCRGATILERVSAAAESIEQDWRGGQDALYTVSLQVGAEKSERISAKYR